MNYKNTRSKNSIRHGFTSQPSATRVDRDIRGARAEQDARLSRFAPAPEGDALLPEEKSTRHVSPAKALAVGALGLVASGVLAIGIFGGRDEGQPAPQNNDPQIARSLRATQPTPDQITQADVVAAQHAQAALTRPPSGK